MGGRCGVGWQGADWWGRACNSGCCGGPCDGAGEPGWWSQAGGARLVEYKRYGTAFCSRPSITTVFSDRPRGRGQNLLCPLCGCVAGPPNVRPARAETTMETNACSCSTSFGTTRPSRPLRPHLWLLHPGAGGRGVAVHEQRGALEVEEFGQPVRRVLPRQVRPPAVARAGSTDANQRSQGQDLSLQRTQINGVKVLICPCGADTRGGSGWHLVAEGCSRCSRHGVSHSPAPLQPDHACTISGTISGTQCCSLTR